MVIATALLNRALITMAARGERPRCADPEDHALWTSEHEGERALAVLHCRGCVVHRECGEAAEARDERFGVWAGIDRTRRPGKAAAA